MMLTFYSLIPDIFSIISYNSFGKLAWFAWAPINKYMPRILRSLHVGSANRINSWFFMFWWFRIFCASLCTTEAHPKTPGERFPAVRVAVNFAWGLSVLAFQAVFRQLLRTTYGMERLRHEVRL